MFAVEVYAAVRRFVFVEGRSRREAARVFGLSRDTISKMCRYSVPPGYVRSKPPERPKLGPLVPVIDAILEADKTAPPKQRHTAKRIFERLRLEHGFAGGYTVVKDYVRLARTKSREVFVPLTHPPGHAQVDFGECIGVIGGVRMKLHVFCFDLPQSDACFIKAYPALLFSAAFRCRFCTIIRRSPWHGFWAMESGSGRGLLPDSSAIIFTGTALGGRARGTIKARSRDWLNIPVRTS
jgi:transposase